jgi:hypothetical protein
MSKYGFYNEVYDNGCSIQTLRTGDGLAQFTDVNHGDGTVAIGIGYGAGDGIIGSKNKHNSKLNKDMLISWQIKFDNQQSVDAMIETLLRVKNTLAIGGAK